VYRFYAFRLSLPWDMQHPLAVLLVDLEIDFILLHSLISAGLVTNLPLGIELATAARSRPPRYIYLLCVVPSYVFVLPASAFLRLFAGMGFITKLWVG